VNYYEKYYIILITILIFSNMIQFTCRGHKNVLSHHKSTLEFTHDEELTLRGDCIVAVKADYALAAIKNAAFSGKISVTMECNGITDSFVAEYHDGFDDPHEMVIRRSEYLDKRTFAIRSTKAAKDIDRKLVEALKDPQAVLVVTIVSFADSISMRTK
jgi:uncharacterized protein